MSNKKKTNTLNTTLSKVQLTGPNLAYSVALQDTLKKLEKMRKEQGATEEYNMLVETIVLSILAQPSMGDS